MTDKNFQERLLAELAHIRKTADLIYWVITAVGIVSLVASMGAIK